MVAALRVIENCVGTAALGCPVERSSTDECRSAMKGSVCEKGSLFHCEVQSGKGVVAALRVIENYVGTAAPGCAVERSSTDECRSPLKGSVCGKRQFYFIARVQSGKGVVAACGGRTAEGGRPYVRCLYVSTWGLRSGTAQDTIEQMGSYHACSPESKFASSGVLAAGARLPASLPGGAAFARPRQPVR